MSRTTTGILAGVVLGAVALGYIALRPTRPGFADSTVTFTISYDPTSNSCSVSTPDGSNSVQAKRQAVLWAQPQNYPFSVNFAQGTAINPGTPFRYAVGGNKFAFSTADPQTSAAVLGFFQSSPHNFYLQTVNVVVGGSVIPCYDRGKIPVEGMKVIVTQ